MISEYPSAWELRAEEDTAGLMELVERDKFSTCEEALGYIYHIERSAEY